MGDLIHKLPTDEIIPNKDEADGILLLFGNKKKEEEENAPPAAAAATSSSDPVIEADRPQLAQEAVSIAMYAVCFFVLSLKWIDQIMQDYIPLCKNSWIIRDVLKSAIFGLLLWILLNRTYL